MFSESDDNNKPSIWARFNKDQHYNFDLPFGFPVGHFYPTTLVKFLTPSMLDLLTISVKGKGIPRTKTRHEGQFHIIGHRHSQMSNKTMNQYTQNLHQYNNTSSINMSVFPWAKSLLNSFQKYVGVMQSQCGMVFDAIAEKVSRWNKKYKRHPGWGIITRYFSNTSEPYILLLSKRNQ